MYYIILIFFLQIKQYVNINFYDENCPEIFQQLILSVK